MFEHVTLQEAYTGALIAGKGKALNNINLIMDRTRIKTEDWARVRFGAGTPWRRCWCVITPPDEKEVQKLQRQVNKKKSAYDRSRPPVLKGDIKFYDTKKTKKVSPIATISNAYSAYAIYPQAKPLIDASTLVKVEGTITIHSSEQPSSTEGFVFVMPEVHPAVSGFEIMLRWLFPVFDIFALYGRPTRLSADTTDPQSLMFAMPKNRRYGYLETLDVSGLILEQGSSEWRESEWRRRMKDLTSKRMTTMESGSRASSRYSSTGRRSTRNSFGPSRARIQFDDTASIRSSPHMGRDPSPAPEPGYGRMPRTDSAPPAPSDPYQPGGTHYRSPSETQILDRFANASSAYDRPSENGPPPPLHNFGTVAPREGSNLRYSNGMGSSPEGVSSEDDVTPPDTRAAEGLDPFGVSTSPEPVTPPPAFSHSPGSLPVSKPWHSPELRKANTRMSNGTILQMVGATGASGMAAATAYRGAGTARSSEGQKLQSTGEEGAGQRDQRESPLGVGNSQPPASPSRAQNGPSVARKPLPRGSYVGQALAYAQTPSSGGNSDGHVFDQAAFGMIGSPSDLKHTNAQNANRSDPSTSSYPEDVHHHQEHDAQAPIPPLHDPWDRPSTSDSVYEDALEHEGPERRRAGVLRTVGNAQETPYGASGNSNPAIPTVDFGPTYSLNPAQAPPSAGMGANPGPAQTRRGDRSPGFMAPTTQGHSRSPSRNVITPEGAHYRSESGESRTLAWQPGMSAAGPNPHAVLTPEEFVQQRAAAVPLYAHHRQNSGNILPLGNRSSDHLAQGHSRHNSADLLQRPSSRGASAALAHRPHYQQYSDPSMQQPPNATASSSPLFAPPPQYFSPPQYLPPKEEHRQ
jgi:hypothetical protein